MKANIVKPVKKLREPIAGRLYRCTSGGFKDHIYLAVKPMCANHPTHNPRPVQLIDVDGFDQVWSSTGGFGSDPEHFEFVGNLEIVE